MRVVRQVFRHAIRARCIQDAFGAIIQAVNVPISEGVMSRSVHGDQTVDGSRPPFSEVSEQRGSLRCLVARTGHGFADSRVPDASVWVRVLDTCIS